MSHGNKNAGPAEWGLDHASRVILKRLYPWADIPVFEMSLDYPFNDWPPKPVQHHYDLARELAELRAGGVLIIGSGNIVHNPGMPDFEDINSAPYVRATEFDEQLKTCLLSGNDRELINYSQIGSSSSLAAPTLDHYLPMIYSIASKDFDLGKPQAYAGK